MSRKKSLIQLLRKTGLIIILILLIIMLTHILITLYLTPWAALYSSAFDAVIAISLYYVIPLIIFLCFYLLMNQLAKLEKLYLSQKKHSKHRHKQLSHSSHVQNLNYKSYRPYPAKSHPHKHSCK